MARLWPLFLKGAVYVLAFWLFGWRVVHRPRWASLGWALLGGLARWLAGMILGLILFALINGIGAPFGLCVLFFALFRLVLWGVLAGFLYEPPRKPLIHFATIMTLLNFAGDLILYGPPKASDFLEPLNWGAFH